MSPVPVDRDRLLRLIERVQPTAMWRGRALACLPDWRVAVRDASDDEIHDWTAACEAAIEAEAGRGTPLLARATIVDVDVPEPFA